MHSWHDFDWYSNGLADRDVRASLHCTEYIEGPPLLRRAETAPRCLYTVRTARMVFRLGELPDELQLWIAIAMGDATIRDWKRLEEACAGSEVKFLPLFTEWSEKQPAGSRFGLCEGAGPELAFVRRHVQCM